ncbi:hypothetical protein ACFWY9_20090 [Amycolatopsis sp. NPDC059027]|uniref:hypothetical protein n=1 Tax=unclassified Amycolatopsis TaxID=2618356 RepID=UPI00366D4AA0
MTVPCYETLAAYNSAHPAAPMSEDATVRAGLRRYTAASAGLKDDLSGAGSGFTIDFLPGGAPADGEPDRTGAVVATRWGAGPYLVLATGVSLRWARNRIVDSWPTTLAHAAGALTGRA